MLYVSCKFRDMLNPRIWRAPSSLVFRYLSGGRYFLQIFKIHKALNNINENFRLTLFQYRNNKGIQRLSIYLNFR